MTVISIADLQIPAPVQLPAAEDRGIGVPDPAPVFGLGS